MGCAHEKYSYAQYAPDTVVLNIPISADVGKLVTFDKPFVESPMIESAL
nr:MAG TPA: hypothetical protein [Caudoviricetes sp.]